MNFAATSFTRGDLLTLPSLWKWLLMPTRSNTHAYPRNHFVEYMHVRTSLDGYGLAEDDEGMTFSLDSGML